jgi:hypothetical protein
MAWHAPPALFALVMLMAAVKKRKKENALEDVAQGRKHRRL